MWMIDSFVRLRWPGAWATTLRASFFFGPRRRAAGGRLRRYQSSLPVASLPGESLPGESLPVEVVRLVLVLAPHQGRERVPRRLALVDDAVDLLGDRE